MRKKLSMAMTAFALSCLVSSAHASVVISGTRVVYQAKEREVTVKLSNEGSSPALVQVWLDTGNPNATPDESDVPFTLTPPLFRLDPKKGQSLRLIYTQEPLPQDKESLFWLNVLEVPPRGQWRGRKRSKFTAVGIPLAHQAVLPSGGTAGRCGRRGCTRALEIRAQG
jgi:chaperone protein EcpD